MVHHPWANTMAIQTAPHHQDLGRHPTPTEMFPCRHPYIEVACDMHKAMGVSFRIIYSLFFFLVPFVVI